MSSAAPYLIQKPGYTPLKDYTELVMQGRNEEAAIINQSLEPARAIFNKWLRDPWPARRVMPIAYLKTWAELLGMVGGAVRPPLLQITDGEREELRQDLIDIGLLQARGRPQGSPPNTRSTPALTMTTTRSCERSF
jgi:4-hydroxy-tetrahydrodipicolinate synthase